MPANSNSSSRSGGRPSGRGKPSSSSRGSSSRGDSSRGNSTRGDSSRSGSSRGGSSRGGSSRGSSSRDSSTRGSGRTVTGRDSSERISSSANKSSTRSSSGRSFSDRPSSGRPRRDDERSSSGRPTSSRPRRDDERSSSGRPSAGRPRRDDERSTSTRSGSGRPSSGRPSAGRPRRDDERPSSSRPRRNDERSSSGRPSSGRPRRDDERSTSTRSGSGRPSSGRPSAGRPRRDDEHKPTTGIKRREWSSERPKASDDRKRGDRPDFRRDETRIRDDRPRGGRPDRAGGKFENRDQRDRRDRRDHDERPPRYISEKRVNVDDPIIPDHITGNELPRAVRNELRTLPDGLALRVARHLAASGEALDLDPELAWTHARAALNKASRVGIVREAAAEAAYNAGHFAEALNEFRAARRMRGIKEYWPLMADCERALGRPAKAIAMAADPVVNSLDRASKVEMRIVASGARVDQKKLEAALATLQCPELTTTSTEPWSARIRYAYADVLEKLNRKDEALEWFHRAAAVDLGEQTDADERIAALEGLVYQDVEDYSNSEED